MAAITELDWRMTGTRSRAMVALAGKRLSARKRQLLACALCRIEWDTLLPEWQRAVVAAERFAEGGSEDALAAARLELFEQPLGVGAMGNAVISAAHPETALALPRCYDCMHFHWQSTRPHSGWQADVCDLVREIAGNPFRPWTTNPAFLGGGLTTPTGKTVPFTSDVRDLARAIAAAQDFDRLPILADAAEEMGLDDAELLEHLRRPGGHVRGCWALDLLDGRG